ncbi:MAG: GTPase domain-containing protein [Cellulomonas sp.]|nr:GTPase domain-containing protein [Cellulomonas sp.]
MVVRDDPLAERDDPRRAAARPLAAAGLVEAVEDLRAAAEHTRFPLRLPGADHAEESRGRLVNQLVEHLLPRLSQLAAPAVVVVAGSTGAGKSTLVNSLVGAEVSQAGVLRPTTRRAVLVHHPADAGLLAGHPVHDDVEVAQTEALPRGIALLDAPDLDSVVEENRDRAYRLLESADLWLFVTTATRYGDALPWRVLQDAASRGTTVAMVLNRTPRQALPKVRKDLQARMREHGLGSAPLFTVPDVGPSTGPLDPEVVAAVSRWMTMLAGPDRARTVVRRTLKGALGALRGWVDELAEAVEDQAVAAGEIGAAVTQALVPVRRDQVAGVRGGSVADGAVRSRWLELTADGAPLAGLVGRGGRIRGGAKDARVRTQAVRPLLDDLAAGARLTLLAARDAAHRAVETTLRDPDGPRGGAALVDQVAVPKTRGRKAAARRAATAWVDDGLAVVRDLLSGGEVNRVGVVLVRRAAVQRGIGAEAVAAMALAGAAGVVDAAETTAAVLGPAGPELVRALRDDLVARVGAAIDVEAELVDDVLADPGLAVDAAARLRLRLAVLKELT